MKLRTGDPSGSLARMLQTLADWLSAPRCMCCVIDHHEVRSAPIAVRMQRKGWFGNRVKELIQILNRPRAIAGLLTCHGALPSSWLRSINKDSNINMLARKRMEGMQPFNDHHICSFHALLANAPMFRERPQGNVGSAATSQCRNVLCQSFQVRRFWEVAQMFRRRVIVGQIVVGTDHAL